MISTAVPPCFLQLYHEDANMTTMEQKDLLISRIEDLADKALKTGFAVSQFLSPAEV